MTLDSLFILAAYVMSCIAIVISLYVLYTLEEEKTNKKKPNNAWDHYHKKAEEQVKPKVYAKGYWD